MSSATSNKRRRLISDFIYVGPPPKELTDVKTLRCIFQDFKNLSQKNGEKLKSDPLQAHGHMFYIHLYPRGEDTVDDGYISFFLNCNDSTNTNRVEVKATFHFPGSITPLTIEKIEFGVGCTDNGFAQVAKHIYVVDNCLDSEGSFIVDIDIQVYVAKKSVWYPKMKSLEVNKQLGHKLLESSEVESDVTFLVGGGGGSGDDDSETFNAHKIVLFCQAPGLYEFIKDVPQGEEFVIPDIEPSTFKILLNHIYTGNIPTELFPQKENDENKDNNDNEGIEMGDDSTESNGNDNTSGVNDETASYNIAEQNNELAKRLLLASNRFGLTYLKLYIESEITSKLLNVDNVADWLLVADAQGCPLLKEQCMILFKANQSKVMSTTSASGWSNVKESPALLVELLQFVNPSCGGGGIATGDGNEDNDDDNKEKYNNMSVRTLREQLELNDLDLDGTKHMLIQRLKEFVDQQKQKSSSSSSSGS